MGASSKVEEIRIIHIYNRRNGKRILSKARGKLCPMTLAPGYLDKKDTNSKKPWRGGTILLSEPHQGVIKSPAECCCTLAKGCLKIPLHRLEDREHHCDHDLWDFKGLKRNARDGMGNNIVAVCEVHTLYGRCPMESPHDIAEQAGCATPWAA